MIILKNLTLRRAAKVLLDSVSLVVNPGEHVGLVGRNGLPCPDAEDRDRLDAFDAARLFVRAAQRMEPSFAPGAHAQAIIEICREVEGLPLALELAATWTRLLTCDEIAAELRQGTRLLRAEDRAWPERHGSMAIVFEHSWQLLLFPPPVCGSLNLRLSPTISSLSRSRSKGARTRWTAS